MPKLLATAAVSRDRRPVDGRRCSRCTPAELLDLDPEHGAVAVQGPASRSCSSSASTTCSSSSWRFARVTPLFLSPRCSRASRCRRRCAPWPPSRSRWVSRRPPTRAPSSPPGPGRARQCSPSSSSSACRRLRAARDLGRARDRRHLPGLHHRLLVRRDDRPDLRQQQRRARPPLRTHGRDDLHHDRRRSVGDRGDGPHLRAGADRRAAGCRPLVGGADRTFSIIFATALQVAAPVLLALVLPMPLRPRHARRPAAQHLQRRPADQDPRRDAAHRHHLPARGALGRARLERSVGAALQSLRVA